MRISFINQKGGVGKSTACALVAAVLKQAGRAVAIEDLDPQGSSSFWAREVGSVSLYDPLNIPEFILTDTPGHLFESTSDGPLTYLRSIQNSDVFVIVSEKTLFGFHSTVRLIALLREKSFDSRKICILYNKVRAASHKDFLGESELASRLGITLLSPSIPMAACVEHFQTSGLRALRRPVLNAVLEISLQLISR